MKNNTTINRRKFLERSALTAGGLIFSTILVGSCTDHAPEPGNTDQAGSFDYGVASFDPTDSKMILWTRVTPINSSVSKVNLTYQIATDMGFTNVLKTELLDAFESDDYTVSMDLSGLKSNTRYYYRFMITNTSIVSPVGETKTLGKDQEISEVKLAVCSCSNYPAGLFNVYGAIAESDADVVLHLGDYIYEYAAGQYGSNPDTLALGRLHEPANEIITLNDYRTRFKQYRSDAQLQLVHQKKPFICVWDDHEVANDAYKDGAQNHNAGEGSFQERKDHAIKAYHEYIGIRTETDAKIYRSFSFGQVLDLHMLDTRIIGRDKQLSYSDYLTQSGINAAAFQKDWLDPTRTILGAEQLAWLSTSIANGKGAWQVLGQQVLMGKMYVPAELLVALVQIVGEVDATGSAKPSTFLAFQTLIVQLTQIKARLLAGDSSLTTAERARVQTVLPYNLDAWDGYPVEREKVYAAAKGKKLVALSGDSHNGWFSKLTANDQSVSGKELATSSVTSPGFEAYLGADAASLAGFEQALALLVDDLDYLDASRRGYVMASFTASQIKAEWRYVSSITTKTTTTTVGHTEVITS
jgi:alkaline phosphatase D